MDSLHTSTRIERELQIPIDGLTRRLGVNPAKNKAGWDRTKAAWTTFWGLRMAEKPFWRCRRNQKSNLDWFGPVNRAWRFTLL